MHGTAIQFTNIVTGTFGIHCGFSDNTRVKWTVLLGVSRVVGAV